MELTCDVYEPDQQILNKTKLSAQQHNNIENIANSLYPNWYSDYEEGLKRNHFILGFEMGINYNPSL